MTDLLIDHVPAPAARAPELDLEPHRRELTVYCYRMLGSTFEAEDAVQETLVRAWRAFDDFEGRASVRTWLYQIATNVCLDMARRPQRRARAMNVAPASGAPKEPSPVRPASAWLEPVPDGRVLPSDDDPAEQAVTRDTIRLAFVAALQHLSPRQRAVLILREVLRWRAAEVAELLDTSVASVKSALHRARATMADRNPADTDVVQPMDTDQRDLLARYLDAFERYDMDSLVHLLHEDATQTLPPFGRASVRGEVVASASPALYSTRTRHPAPREGHHMRAHHTPPTDTASPRSSATPDPSGWQDNVGPPATADEEVRP